MTHFEGRYSTSPPVIFRFEEGLDGERQRKTFDRNINYDFGLYGQPNEIQIRNMSGNRIEFIVNDEYVYRIPPSIIENFDFSREGIKNFSIQNIEEFATDDLIQVVVQKSVTQPLLFARIFTWLDKRFSGAI